LEPPSLELLTNLILVADPAIGQIIGWAILLVLLMCSALISGSEVAYFSLTPVQLADLESGEATPSSQRIVGLLKLPKRLLATILIVNNMVNVGIILLSSILIESQIPEHWVDWEKFWFSTVCITFTLLLLGEVIPKVYATKYSMRLARLMSVPLLQLRWLVHPISWCLIRMTNVVDRNIKNKDESITVDKLEVALELTSDHQTSEEEQKILKGIVRFGNTEVKQIMCPRTDITAFEVETPYSEILGQIVKSGFSRLPIYRENFDKIEGILYIKDLLNDLSADDSFDWRSIARKPFFVPENKKIDDLMREFQEKKIHMAVVVDEYGGTCGIVTLEDILEEVIGEISDEFDDDDISYSKLDEFNYVFEGKTHITDVYRVLEIEDDPFDDAKGDSDTLGGFMLELFGRIPVKNEYIVYKNYTFTIEAADRRRIKRVKLTMVATENPDK